MGMVDSNALDLLFAILEGVFLLILPFMTWLWGYKFGLREASEPSFRLTRGKHRNKLRY